MNMIYIKILAFLLCWVVCGICYIAGWMICKFSHYSGDLLIDDTVDTERRYHLNINCDAEDLEKKKFIVIKIIKGANLRETNIAHDEHKNI